MEVNRPSQKNQTSRKGKKAWRKNVDIDDIEIGLEERREEIRVHGEELDKVSSDSLFTVDTDGDAALFKKSITPHKVLKSTEILSRRSKAPGFSNKHKKLDNKIDGVKKKDIHRLMKIAGRVANESSIKAIHDKDGLMKGQKVYDVWGEEEPVQSKKNSTPKPEILEKFSSIGFTAPTNAPSTIKVKPLTVKEVEAIPDAGKSYNPSLESWKDLIDKQYTTQKEKEDKRIELEAYSHKVRKLIQSLDDKEEYSDSEDEEEEEAQVEEEIDEEDKYALSINLPVENKKKTKHQRNKMKRHQERMELEAQLKSLKAQITELQKVETIQAEVEAQQPNFKSDIAERRVAKSKKLGTRYHVLEDAIEVKLSDELTDSLRGLKSEGNLLYDQMRKLQSDGKIESRFATKKKRKYTPKITEKWTYKDLK
ncbi:hypothetical protein WICPIJ_001273 [Wickerhamomyces pijperi]|uniref:Ribosome biogenesis protein NOP53 n=1 Tax=Wickerhamomyces pijperi TaxID=599730 RepID=A0A9P8QEA6_WICPI|nr:hypothetical protein WICPIJ_001273 [Wickerhamomyces pijperi]